MKYRVRGSRTNRGNSLLESMLKRNVNSLYETDIDFDNIDLDDIENNAQEYDDKVKAHADEIGRDTTVSDSITNIRKVNMQQIKEDAKKVFGDKCIPTYDGSTLTLDGICVMRGPSNVKNAPGSLLFENSSFISRKLFVDKIVFKGHLIVSCRNLPAFKPFNEIKSFYDMAANEPAYNNAANESVRTVRRRSPYAVNESRMGVLSDMRPSEFVQEVGGVILLDRITGFADGNLPAETGETIAESLNEAVEAVGQISDSLPRSLTYMAVLDDNNELSSAWKVLQSKQGAETFAYRAGDNLERLDIQPVVTTDAAAEA